MRRGVGLTEGGCTCDTSRTPLSTAGGGDGKHAVNGTSHMFGWIGKAFLKLIGGTRNERLVRAKLQFVRERINPLEPQMRELTDEQMLEKSHELRRRLEDGEPREAVRPEAFALVREASRRAQKHRHFDVQLVAGMVLDEGTIAEEATGEGKTIACFPAMYLAVLEGLKVHLVTTNDYLVRVGAEFAKPVFELLGVTVGYITSDMSAYGPEAAPRREAYQCDITYGMNSEFGFDYLRDNMKMSAAEQVQGELGFAIVDEVDNILIDEARTPLIISGPAHGQTNLYRKADSIARDLIRRNQQWDQANNRVEALKREIKSLEGQADRGGDGKAREKLKKAQEDLEEADRKLAQQTKYYEVELDKKSVHMTHEGVGAAQDIAGVGSFYVGANMEWPHLMTQALRAHLVFEKDKDYVVQDGRIIIVDEFTGRLLEGRQWSDGLHQAVEAKEGVTIKEETQTLATVTLQNYFKLYKRLAGMTGTAMTEASEFLKIYNLDAVAVPTHRPICRVDHNDLIFGEAEGKYKAIVEEINKVSKAGRPVLVGTTSIERSEKISQMLQRTYGIEHQVLNGRLENATRESEIVKNAGMQKPLKAGSKQMIGTVTIATNMAGRGTDIKLGPGVVYDKCRVPSDEKLRELGLEPEELYPAGVSKCCIGCEQYDPVNNCAHCFKPKLDDAFPDRGKLECTKSVPCGLHIVGTERHEARRIDNQLRGRAGRQGDPGSSRFFLSLRDELMAIFAGEWTLKVLSWLGLQGDAAIEDKRVSKGVERAQRKVEERNFEVRKNLLEYDESMDHQRSEFYSRRQKILEGRQLEGLVMDLVDESLAEAVGSYLDGNYVRRCIAEWARQTLQIALEPADVRAEDLDDLDSLTSDLRERARDEAANTISMTLGEYVDPEADRKEWDLRGLSSWAMSRFRVNVSQNQLRKMEPEQIEQELIGQAAEQIDQQDLTGVARYLEPGFAQASLAEWVQAKFGLEMTVEELSGEIEDVQARLTDRVAELYRQREIEYPVEYAMDMTLGAQGPENVYALNALADWANRKYALDWTGEQLQAKAPAEIYKELRAQSEQWQDESFLADAVRQAVGPDPDIAAAIKYARERFDTPLNEDDFDGDVTGRLVQAGMRFFRREMTSLERYVLLQIYDSAWKDHLLGMDHLKGSIGLRGYAEQDPKVAYKREGARQYEEMLSSVREKVTGMIFKVRLSADTQQSSVYQVSDTVHRQLSGYGHLAGQQNLADQAQQTEQTKVQTIRRDIPKVGRNDPCPCGSGKKYKKCCGQNA